MVVSRVNSLEITSEFGFPPNFAMEGRGEGVGVNANSPSLCADCKHGPRVCKPPPSPHSLICSFCNFVARVRNSSRSRCRRPISLCLTPTRWCRLFPKGNKKAWFLNHFCQLNQGSIIQRAFRVVCECFYCGAIEAESYYFIETTMQAIFFIHPLMTYRLVSVRIREWSKES